MANILVLPSEVVGEAESGNSYAFPADNIIMSDKVTSVEEAINNKPGEKIPGTEEDSVGGEIFNDYTNNIASGEYSHAEGTTATASGYSSHAEGSITIASGDFSHAEGYYTTASGNYSHAEGDHTIASSKYQHVQGRYNVEDTESKYAHIVGWGSRPTSRKNIHTITTTGDGWFAGKVSAGTVETPSEPTEANDLITKKYFDENSGSGVGQSYPNEVDEVNNPMGAPGEIFNVYEDSEELPGIKKNIASGAYSHAEGANTTASGAYSHAEGANTTASGNGSHTEGFQTTASEMFSHAEGTDTTASGIGSHTEGEHTEAIGDSSHAEGSFTTASGNYSHAEGSNATASGECSHSEGSNATASGMCSHAEGSYTIAASECQHVQGKYNVEDSENKYAHIVGWGTPGLRANIHTIDTNGNGWFSGKVSAGTVDTPAEPVEANDLITKKYFDENSSSDVGQKSIKEGDTDGIGGEIFNDYTDNIASGNYSHAEGSGTEASGVGSHAEGVRTTSSSQGSHSEGVNTSASGQAAHSEGHSATASGMYSHAEGFQTTASATYSHAEGSFTHASGDISHAEGSSTEASGAISHAEGDTTTASGDYSHAEGMCTIAASEAQHVQGKYNIEDADGVYAHIVGWGKRTSSRANIHTITTTGDGWFAGKVSAGTEDSPATPTADNDLITKKYFDDNVGSSGGGGEQGITNVIAHTTSVGPTIVGSFGNLTQLPSGYTYDNTVILGFYISTDSSIYFGGSCPAFNIRITNTNYIQINVTNNILSAGTHWSLY